MDGPAIASLFSAVDKHALLILAHWKPTSSFIQIFSLSPQNYRRKLASTYSWSLTKISRADLQCCDKSNERYWWLIKTFKYLKKSRMETKIINQHSFHEPLGLKNKKRRTQKSQGNGEIGLLAAKIAKTSEAPCSSNILNDLFFLNSPAVGAEDDQKPRSHANARERDRTHRYRNTLPIQLTVVKHGDIPNSVNSAFNALRTLIPTGNLVSERWSLKVPCALKKSRPIFSEPADRKLSKIETLRLASSYIAHLGTQLLAGNLNT